MRRLSFVLFCLFLFFIGCLKPVVVKKETSSKKVSSKIPDTLKAKNTVIIEDTTAYHEKAEPDSIIVKEVKEKKSQIDSLRDTLKTYQVKRNSVRVLLKSTSSKKRISISNPYAVYNDKNQKISLLKDDFSVTTYNNNILINNKTYDSDFLRIIPLTKDFCFSFNNKKYRGNIILKMNSNKIYIINELSIDDYLKGVVPYEIGKRDSQYMEALKVQAIVARTYTYSRLNKHFDEGFDVYPDVSDQVYNGIESEYDLSNKAVESTKDIIIIHNDSLIDAYYFSTSSGRTANIEEVWPDKGYRPYLRSIEDSIYNASSKYFIWKETWSYYQLNNIVNQYMPRFFSDFKRDRLKNLYVEKRTSSGRVRSLAVKIGNRTYRLIGDKTRWLLRRKQKGHPILRSACFDIKLTKKSGKIKNITAIGRGYGHGVGLSQIGALEMAKMGLMYRQIIYKYYKDVQLAKVVF